MRCPPFVHAAAQRRRKLPLFVATSAEDPPGLGGRRFGRTKGLGYLLKMHDQMNGKSLRTARFQRAECENVFLTHLFYRAPPTNHLEQTVVSELLESGPGDSGDKSGGAE